MQLTTYYL